MQATVHGIKKLDFTGREGDKVKKTIYYVGFENENVEGQEVGNVVWDELKSKEKAPDCAVGEVIEVEYNKYGKLRIVA
jgi:hypothetical protein